MDDNELFENLCFSPAWQEKEPEMPAIAQIRQHKSMTELLGELEDIKEDLQHIQEKQWNLANLIRFHESGFAK
ncbi:hypothetical protein J6S88_05960 [bacterium]|nr:hypothetical protein [bacterium]